MARKSATETENQTEHVLPTDTPPASNKISFEPVKGAVDFDAIEGESFVGLNLLDLAVDEADGPFTVKEIVQKEFGTGKNKKMIGVYETLKGSTPVSMPISASFTTKAAEARLDVGDVFYVKRAKDFKSKEFGTDNCKSYLIKVTQRA